MAKNNYKTPSAKDLLDAGVHFGHQVRRWHPRMEPYIFTVKKNIHIIDLEKTEQLLKEACDYLYGVAARGEQIIFVGTKKQARDMIKLEAKRSGAMYINERWLGGIMTNHEVIKKNMKKLVDLMHRRETGDLMKYTKKERLLIDREIDKLEKYVGGIVGLHKNPEALFVIDARREKTAIREAANVGVKVVALVDTNTDPTGIDMVIPGNDDGIRSIALVLQAVGDAVEAGYKEYADKLQKGEATVATKKAEPVAKAVTPKVSSSESPVVTASGKDSTDSLDIVPLVADDTEIVEELGIKVEIPVAEEAKEGEVKVKKNKANVTKKEKKGK